jgi:hypothetical protein
MAGESVGEIANAIVIGIKTGTGIGIETERGREKGTGTGTGIGNGNGNGNESATATVIAIEGRQSLTEQDEKKQVSGRCNLVKASSSMLVRQPALKDGTVARFW